MLDHRLLTLLATSIFMAFLLVQQASAASDQGNTTSAGKPYIVEYYYKVKWGHADEFLALFKKNHYPFLKKQIELGRMLRVDMVQARFHTTEDGRWDYKVTIIYKNIGVTDDGFDEAALLKQLFPDQDTYKREEQRRFEILDGHWDVPVKEVDLNSK